MRLPDTGDLGADLRTVMRATVAEFADPAFEAPIRALNLEIIADPALADAYRESWPTPSTRPRRNGCAAPSRPASSPPTRTSTWC